MPLSWNEIQDCALKFSREWQNESSKDAEAKSFWDGFFDVFGVSRRRVTNLERYQHRISLLPTTKPKATARRNPARTPE